MFNSAYLIAYFAISLFVTFLYEKFAIRFAWVDTPNHRSSHQKVTPRGAGFVFSTIWAVFLIFVPIPINLKLLFLPGFILNGALGFLDDKYTFPAKMKLAIQLLASLYFAVILAYQSDIPWSWYSLPVLVLWCTASLNIFNFMDGLDGLAACHALLFLIPSTVLLLHVPGFTVMAWAVCYLCIGLLAFLCFNFPPARVFMGDVGSCSLGFLIGCISMIFLLFDFHYFVASILFFGMFLCDTSLTLMRRYFAGERVFDAHKKHAYQRLNQIGYSHSQVLKVSVGLQIIFSAIGLWVARERAWLCDAISLVALFAIFLVYYFYIEKRKPMFG